MAVNGRPTAGEGPVAEGKVEVLYPRPKTCGSTEGKGGLILAPAQKATRCPKCLPPKERKTLGKDNINRNDPRNEPLKESKSLGKKVKVKVIFI